MCTHESNQKLRRADTIVTRSIGDSIVLVPVSGDKGDLESIYRLDDTGAFVWEQLAISRSVKELTDLVTKHFQVSREQAHADLFTFIAEMRDAGLLRNVP